MFLITRSGAEHWTKFLGRTFDWPADWVYKIDGKPVTRSQLRERRKREQLEHLHAIVHANETFFRPAQVWVFSVSGLIYGGWHLYVKTAKNRVWVRGGDNDLAQSIMKCFPCGVLPCVGSFLDWKKSFWEQYKRGSGIDARGRLSASAFGWLEESGGRLGDGFWISKPQENNMRLPI